MFEYSTTLKCDQCGYGCSSDGFRIADCMSREDLESMVAEEGWIKLYDRYNSCYNICDRCVAHYGEKYLRDKFNGDNNED